jgi:hypothetical protein
MSCGDCLAPRALTERARRVTRDARGEGVERRTAAMRAGVGTRTRPRGRRSRASRSGLTRRTGQRAHWTRQ